jgi:hypothetical protein
MFLDLLDDITQNQRQPIDYLKTSRLTTEAIPKSSVENYNDARLGVVFARELGYILSHIAYLRGPLLIAPSSASMPCSTRSSFSLSRS